MNQTTNELTRRPKSEHCLVPLTGPMTKALEGLFLLIQHPYLVPISNIDLLAEQNNVVRRAGSMPTDAFVVIPLFQH
jgi:hypothetical protein